MKASVIFLLLILLVQMTVAIPTDLSDVFSTDNSDSGILPDAMKEELRSQSKESYQSIIKSLPENHDERKEMTINYAEEVCGVPNPTKYEDGIESSTEAQVLVKQFQYGLGVMNRYLDTGLYADDLSLVYGNTKEIAKYASAIDSYEIWRKRGCEVEENPTNESMKKLYDATAVLTFELILIQVAPSYKIASKATRMINTGAGMAKIRRLCGVECYSWSLSISHWTVRLPSDGLFGYILQESNKRGIELPESEAKDISSNIASDLSLEEKVDQAKTVTGQVTKTASKELEESTSEDGFLGSIIDWLFSLIGG